mmetsp:Transcript_14325/g.31355  ORF Transcript_14325/g.31355 Transcript_14325/m.31355 type:complete len:200 (+) Transcript_14325:1727-2326(+)
MSFSSVAALRTFSSFSATSSTFFWGDAVAFFAETETSSVPPSAAPTPGSEISEISVSMAEGVTDVVSSPSASACASASASAASASVSTSAASSTGSGHGSNRSSSSYRDHSVACDETLASTLSASGTSAAALRLAARTDGTAARTALSPSFGLHSGDPSLVRRSRGGATSSPTRRSFLPLPSFLLLSCLRTGRGTVTVT